MSTQKNHDLENVAPSINDMLDALNRSGYLLECRVAELLQNSGFRVSLNSPYLDPEEGKSREHDIIATKNFGFIDAHLLIECKNPPYPIAFFTRSVTEPFGPYIQSVHVPDFLRNDGTIYGELLSYIGLRQNSHYRRPKLATQYCTFEPKKSKKTEWMATHGREDGDRSRCPFRTLVSVTEHQMTKMKSMNEFWQLTASIDIYYPILLFSCDLYEVSAQPSVPSFDKVDHVLYQLSLETPKSELSYHIDVVTENALPVLVAEIEKELLQANKAILETVPEGTFKHYSKELPGST